MPALQQIFNSMSKIQFSAHSLEVISSEIQKYKPVSEINRSKVISNLPIAESFGLKDVSFSYQEDKQIVSDISIDIKKGERIGIIGKSGEGKSTIIDLLIGLITPQTGGIVIDGKEVPPDNYESWRTNISYTSQSSYLLDDSIDMNIALEANSEQCDTDHLNQVKDAALVHFKVEDADSVGENGQRLSGGQKQRIGIARALYQSRPILILDEATSALDSHTEHEILTNISRLEKTLILISHRVETLKFCDRIYIVSQGKIVESGSYDHLNKKSDYFKELLRSNKTS
jgi:HlyD family secretion protein